MHLSVDTAAVACLAAAASIPLQLLIIIQPAHPSNTVFQSSHHPRSFVHLMLAAIRCTFIRASFSNLLLTRS